MFEALGIAMRWLHIASVVTLIGGMLYGWLVMVPALAALPADEREKVAARAASRWRPLIFTVIATLLISGSFTLATHPGHHNIYYVAFSIKLLLVAHVFAVGIVLVTKNPEHRGRLMAGAAISGLIIIAISAYLRQTF